MGHGVTLLGQSEPSTVDGSVTYIDPMDFGTNCGEQSQPPPHPLALIPEGSLAGRVTSLTGPTGSETLQVTLVSFPSMSPN